MSDSDYKGRKLRFENIRRESLKVEKRVSGGKKLINLFYMLY